METKLTRAEAFVELDAARRRSPGRSRRLDARRLGSTDALRGLAGARGRLASSRRRPDARLSRVFPKVIAARGRVDVMLDRMARQVGDRPVAEIREHYRRNVEARSLPPGVSPQQFLTDVVIHSLDITEPNGWHLELPVERIRIALSTLVQLEWALPGSPAGRGPALRHHRHRLACRLWRPRPGPVAGDVARPRRAPTDVRRALRRRASRCFAPADRLPGPDSAGGVIRRCSASGSYGRTSVIGAAGRGRSSAGTHRGPPGPPTPGHRPAPSGRPTRSAGRAPSA